MRADIMVQVRNLVKQQNKAFFSKQQKKKSRYLKTMLRTGKDCSIKAREQEVKSPPKTRKQ
jgi:hypothetical protein